MNDTKVQVEVVERHGQQVGRSGIGLAGLVFLVLLILKLTGTATISWFWVFFPLWIVPAAFLGILLAIGTIGGLIWLGFKLKGLFGS